MNYDLLFSKLVSDFLSVAPAYATTAAGFSIGSTSVALGAGGVGLIMAGDQLTFAGDATVYAAAASVIGSGPLLLTSGLVHAIPAAVTAITVTPALPRYYTDDRATAVPPCLITTGAIREINSKQCKLEVEVLLRTSPPTEGGDPRDDAIAWLDAVAAYVQSVPLFTAFLLTDAATPIPADIAVLRREVTGLGRVTDTAEGHRQHALVIHYHLARGLS